MSASADVTADGIAKSYGTFQALKNVSLTVEAGEFLTLLGPSGSGKTTFLMILAGFEAPTRGRLLRGGADITAVSAEERAFGMVFQGYALFPHMTVAENIAFPLVVRKRPRAEIASRVAAIVERVGLAGHANKRPAKLSGGQQQRVALARALVFEPAMLLLDEPFSALDKHLRGLMQDEVRRLHGELGTTFVFVTHDQSEALSLSSRVAIFNGGDVLQIGAPKTVYERPENRFVAEFLGEINMLPLDGVAPDGAGAAGRFEDVGLSAPARAGAGADALLAVRPEHMRLAEGPVAACENALLARVTAATYLGPATRLQLRTKGGTPLTVTLPSGAAGLAAQGCEVRLAWAKDKGFLLPASAALAPSDAPATFQDTLPPTPSHHGDRP